MRGSRASATPERELITFSLENRPLRQRKRQYIKVQRGSLHRNTKVKASLHCRRKIGIVRDTAPSLKRNAAYVSDEGRPQEWIAHTCSSRAQR